MQATILNREFQRPADGWYALEVPGEHPNRAADVVQVIDEAAVASIVRRFNQEAEHYEAQNGVAFPGMLVDIEHFKHDASKETRAYGWLMRLQNRNGVPYGQIRWTAVGQQAVDGGEYRFFSTEYDPKDVTVLNGGKPSRVRPMRLDGLTLTNEPNNRGGKPITNRSRNRSANERPAATSPEVLENRAPEKTPELISATALDGWFKVVEKTRRAAVHSSQSLTFQQSWQRAKVHFPDQYAAAFDRVNRTPAGEARHSRAAMQGLVADMANRIKQAAGADYRFGFNFVREHLPGLFNRMNPADAPVLNRGQAEDGPGALQNIAAKLFNRLVSEEQMRSRHTLSTAFQRVMAREKVLGDLAAGRLTPEQACAEEPELRSRLRDETA